MPTVNRGYATPATGSLVDTWGPVLNSNFDLIDSNLGGVASIAIAAANVTLNAAQAACGTISISGNPSANILILFPDVQGWWTVRNLQSAGAFYVAARCVAGGNQIGLPPGESIDIFSDGVNMNYRNLYGTIGSYMDDAGDAVPAWITGSTIPPYLLCDGSIYSSATYPYLFAKLGTTTLPDARGSLRATLNGGTGRITTAGSSIDGNTRFSRGGEQAVLLNRTMLPSMITDTKLIVAVPGSSPFGVTTGSSTIPTPNSPTSIDAGFQTITNGGLSHQNMPPTYIGGITMIRAA